MITQISKILNTQEYLRPYSLTCLTRDRSENEKKISLNNVLVQRNYKFILEWNYKFTMAIIISGKWLEDSFLNKRCKNIVNMRWEKCI